MAKLLEVRQLQREVHRREQERLARADVFTQLGYVPTPRQREFHDATEFDVLYGGAVGGGKLVPS